MTLLAVRTLFVQATGRSDLITTQGADNGANNFINAGQQLLDQMVSIRDVNRLRESYTKASGTAYFEVAGCRVVEEVYMQYADDTGTTVREKLQKVDCDMFNQLEPPTENGIPTCYADDTTAFSYASALTPAPSTTGRYISLYPATDRSIAFIVFGRFFTKTLSSDTDTSFWTERHPMLLAMAAAYKLEAFYRNTEGMRAWMEAINTEVVLIRRDEIVRETVGKDSING